MKAKQSRLPAWIMLGLFIPTVLGFAFIHHHCPVCKSNVIETSLSIIPHQHNGDECLCKADSNAPASCHAGGEATCNCDGIAENGHEPSCEVSFKKLSFTGNVLTQAKVLPNPAELDFTFMSSQAPLPLFAAAASLQQIPLQFNTDPPSSGEDLSIENCVFRL